MKLENKLNIPPTKPSIRIFVHQAKNKIDLFEIKINAINRYKLSVYSSDMFLISVSHFLSNGTKRIYIKNEVVKPVFISTMELPQSKDFDIISSIKWCRK